MIDEPGTPAPNTHPIQPVVRLTPKRAHVLRILARHTDEYPLSGPEIGASRFARRGVKHGLREWATPALNALETTGAVERLGKSSTGAWCWRITEAGRSLLSQTEGEAP